VCVGDGACGLTGVSVFLFPFLFTLSILSSIPLRSPVGYTIHSRVYWGVYIACISAYLGIKSGGHPTGASTYLTLRITPGRSTVSLDTEYPTILTTLQISRPLLKYRVQSANKV
jgi:hypothetical protein